MIWRVAFSFAAQPISRSLTRSLSGRFAAASDKSGSGRAGGSTGGAMITVGCGCRRSRGRCRTLMRRSGLGPPRRRRALQGTETFGKFAVLRLQLPEHAPESCHVLVLRGGGIRRDKQDEAEQCRHGAKDKWVHGADAVPAARS